MTRPSRRLVLWLAIAAAVLSATSVLVWSGSRSDDSPSSTASRRDAGPTTIETTKPRRHRAQPAASPTAPAPDPTGSVTMVLAVSIDGLGSTYLRDVGPDGAPVLWRLMAQGASTLDARTEQEQTITLPNHVGMVTSRRIDAQHGGHGWTINYDDGSRVLDADGTPVPSIFDTVTAAGGTSAVFASKSKFAIFPRTWPSIDDYSYTEDNVLLAQRAAQTLDTVRPSFTFLHLSDTDVAGHATGWGSPAYETALARVDGALGDLMETVDASSYLRRHLVIIVTADHGGTGRGHGDPRNPLDFTVPFIVWGPGVAEGADLYDLDRSLRDPGERRTDYESRKQPVRNGDVANLAAGLLGLDPVPGSQLATGSLRLQLPADAR